MSDIHPSIINQIRREALSKDPNRNVIPTQRRAEEEPQAEIEPPTTTALGRLAMRLNLIGGTGET